jgi:hypothetical protein
VKVLGTCVQILIESGVISIVSVAVPMVFDISIAIPGTFSSFNNHIYN